MPKLQQKIIGVDQRFADHPDRETIMGMISAARAGGEVVFPWFEKVKQGRADELQAVVKATDYADDGYENVMTLADTETQTAVINALKQVKDIPVEGEEDDAHRCDMDALDVGTQRWLIDPIDGTFCFKNGIADFSITIALQTKQPDGSWSTDIGLVFDPCQNEIYMADAEKAYLVQGNREKQLLLAQPESHEFKPINQVLQENPKICNVVFSTKNKKLDALRDRLNERLEPYGGGMMVFSTAILLARMADRWNDGAVIIGAPLTDCDWDTAAALHIAEKAGAQIHRFEIAGEPACIVAKDAQVAQALLHTVKDMVKEAGLETSKGTRSL